MESTPEGGRHHKKQGTDSFGALASIWDFVGRCGCHETADSLFADFSVLISTFGFDHFIMAGLPAFGENVADLIVRNEWPSGWTKRYGEERYFIDDPVSRWSFAATRPFTWVNARERIPETARSQVIESEAADFGLIDGLGFPIFDPDNWQSVVSLASDGPIRIDAQLTNFIYLAALTCRMSAIELVHTPDSTPTLTSRESEILSWVAAGKSNWEIASIIGISQATVNSHLANVRRKLGTVNTTQAVARAIRARQIHL